jgi:hypothetical protein
VHGGDEDGGGELVEIVGRYVARLGEEGAVDVGELAAVAHEGGDGVSGVAEGGDGGDEGRVFAGCVGGWAVGGGWGGFPEVLEIFFYQCRRGGSFVAFGNRHFFGLSRWEYPCF